jgi:hypothetical protein
MHVHLVNLIKSRTGPTHVLSADVHFDDYNDQRVMVVECAPAKAPVFLQDGNVERFYIRTGAATTELKASETQEYLGQRHRDEEPSGEGTGLCEQPPWLPCGGRGDAADRHVAYGLQHVRVAGQGSWRRGLRDTTIHRMLSDLTFILMGEGDYRGKNTHVVLGGDLNISVQCDERWGTAARYTRAHDLLRSVRGLRAHRLLQAAHRLCADLAPRAVVDTVAERLHLRVQGFGWRSAVLCGS